MKLKGSFLESSLFNLIASSCNKFFIFFVSFFSAYVLNSEEHGALSIFVFLVSVVSGILMQSITVAANRTLSVNKGVLNKNSLSECLSLVAVSIFIWLLVCSATLYDIDASIDFLTSGTANDVEIYILLSLVPLNITIGIVAGILQGQQAFRLLALANIVPVIFLIPIAFLLIEKQGVLGAIEGLLLHSIFTAGCHLFMLLKRNKVTLFQSISLSQLGKGEVALRVFLPLLITSAFVSPAYWYATKLLAGEPNGLAQTSLFALLWQFGMILTQVIVSLGGVIMPKISQDQISYEKNPLNYLPTMLASVVFIVPIILSLRFWGDYFLNEFSADEYMSCALMISGALFISAFKSGIARVIALKGKGWISIISNAFWLVSFLLIIEYTPTLSAVSLSRAILLAHSISLLVFLPVFYWNNLVSISVLVSKPIFPIIVCFCFSVIVANYSMSIYVNLSVACVLLAYIIISVIKEKKLL